MWCRVIDNFGDAGVTWRLARRLRDLGLAVRLVVDRPDVLAKLVPELDPDQAESVVRGIAVARWDDRAACAAEVLAELEIPAGKAHEESEEHASEGAFARSASDLTIEAFGCRLPEAVEALLARSREERVARGLPAEGSGFLYMNLDYLSAEDWVEACHDVWGLHPNLPLRKLWYFPGFTARTGGLLIEDNLREDTEDFAHRRDDILRALGAKPERPALFLFAYPVNALARLADGIAASAAVEPLTVLAAPGAAGDEIERLLQGRAGVDVCRTPFVPQEAFDDLLRASDAVVIRGEDSFVRAQLAGKSLLWATYPTEDNAHLIKMDAWLARVVPALAETDPESARILETANREWLSGELEPETFAAWWRSRGAIERGMARWRDRLFAHGDLARRIVERAERVEGS
ncbi:elongation factor P maturation arginine rhamnosyltransferase EarP [Sutterella megalosphaeroides]|uniref:elongation factor P maturation arginine rhamnosyltransferase EarP n=1 Tax=Sutterella megalosphaeroides TaxID=2494234 RepID=UPI0038CD6C96